MLRGLGKHPTEAFLTELITNLEMEGTVTLTTLPLVSGKTHGKGRGKDS